ncbi:MAG: Gfo/Idh/MocA family oxidoreductase [Ignavibacteria bacterium]|jgi:predicted dehydrogenase
MEKSRIGIIGLGGISQIAHLPVLSKLHNIKIEAIADIEKNRLYSIAEKYNIANTYTDYKEMLAGNNLDAVIIATPTNTHKDIAIDCLNNGKHILIEKPIARTLEEAIEISKTAAEKNKVAMVGMNFRFRPDAMMMKSLIASKELGDVFYVKCSWMKQQSSSEKWFIEKNISGGGVIIDLGIVLLDLAIWLIDYPKVKSVSVQSFRHKTTEVEDTAIGILKFGNGAVINFDVSWTLQSEEDRFYLTAYGTKGTVQLNPLRAYKKNDYTTIDLTPSQTSNQKNLYKKSFENELKHFIVTINGQIKTISSSEESLERMKLLEAIYKASETQKEIIL